MPLEKRKFTTGMDGDSVQEDVIPTSYRYALNIRSMSSDGQNEGAITNVKGNLLVTTPLSVGVNKVIGSYEDKQRSKSYFFVSNSKGSDRILEYDSATNVVSVVLIGFLNLDSNFLITGINVIELDANNHLLYWTDDNEEPKKINIEKGKYYISTGGNPLNSPLGYIAPFSSEYLYRIKTPDLHPPSCTYADDAKRNVNLLTGHLFQFKTEYVYDDFEQSATSPISVVPFPTLNCNQSPAPNTNNKITISAFTGSEIVTHIKILGREGNTGDFFEIINLDKSLLNIASNTTTPLYDFYNDQIYNTIDINQSIKLFDNVPLKSKAQELIEGERITDGNILEGYDPVDINAQLSLNILPDPSPQLFGFSGQIYIGNFFVTDPSYQYQQPIHSLDGTAGNAVFGGFTKGLISGSYVDPTVGSSYKQTIPLGGFVAYLAGTNYYAISHQTNPSNVTTISPQNIFVSDNSGRIDAIGNAISANNQVWSQFDFKGVPAGNYVLRFASHFTTQSDLSAANLDWQKTSTNTICVGGYDNHECPIEIQANGTIVAGTFTTSNGGFINPSMIMDLTYPVPFNILNPTFTYGSQVINGYVTDKDLPVPTNTASALADTRIELSRVNFNIAASYIPPTTWNQVLLQAHTQIPSSYLDPNGFIQGNSVELGVGDYSNNRTFTDHNGYFYVPCVTVSTLSLAAESLLTVTGIYSGVNNLSATQYQYASPPTPYVSPNDFGTYMGIFRNTSGTVSDNSRTKLIGDVSYNGSSVSGVSVTSAKGRTVYTDYNGDFQLVVYVNTRFYVNASLLVRQDFLYYNVSDVCIATFIPAIDYYSINIMAATTPYSKSLVSPYTGIYDYNNNTVTLTNAIIASIIGGTSVPSLKRGSVYQMGIVYYDHANRSGLTNTNDNAYNTQNIQGLYGNKLTIPFFTDINPNTSLIYGGSQPEVSWGIFNQPPIWATHYQWVRTLNAVPNRYLQFTANDVVYTNDARTPVAPVAATLIGINIKNIASYANLHGDSIINFGKSATNTAVFLPEIGDRIRFIKNNAGNYFNSYIDQKIVNVDPAGIVYIENTVALPQIFPNTLFEIYTPKLQSSNQIYYEFGECYDIGNPGQTNRYHKGQTGDQSTVFTPNAFGHLVSSVAATGTFSNGDTYTRFRTMPNINNVLGAAPILIEDANFSDFYSSKVQDIGRPNKVDRTFRQVRRKSTIYYSEKFVPETKINGLSSVFDTSFETYEAQYGGIQKLFNYNLRLDCYQELKTGAIPVNQVQFQSTSVGGGDVVGSTSTVLNPIRYYAGEFGIGLNPESFAYYGGSRYFFDLKRGAVLRLANDGLTPIDDYKESNYFTQKSRDILATGIRPNIYGTFDVRFSEYIMAFETNSAVPNETISFNEKHNAWATFYSYLPENMTTNGVDIITFKSGELFTHNTNPVYNNFYNTQYASEVWAISNAIPSKNKSLQAISEECPVVWEVYDISTTNGQSSNLINSDFETKQNLQYAGVLRDINTPNVVNGLIEGQEMVDTSFMAKFRNSLTTFVKMYAVNFYWSESERSNR